jgi:hypothetical protein
VDDIGLLILFAKEHFNSTILLADEPKLALLVRQIACRSGPKRIELSDDLAQDNDVTHSA